MSCSDALLYKLILGILNISAKILFPHNDLKQFYFRGTALTTFGIWGPKPFSFHDLGVSLFGYLAPSSPYVESPML